MLALPALAAVAPGRITVYSVPSNADVCIDTDDCDITPATFTVAGNDWHLVVVRQQGFRDWSEAVYVTTEQTNSVTAYLDLNPELTAIRVNVTPGGGTICLDNIQCREKVGTVGSTAGTLFTGVSPGYHTISVEAPVDFLDTTRLVQVTLGKTTNVSISLDPFIAPQTTAPPATGIVRVWVDRTGSTVCLDNTRCVYNVGGSPGPGTGTTIFDDVTTTGTHIVTVVADGYRPFSAPVSVAKNELTNVDVRLQPNTGGTPVPTTTAPVTTVTTVPTTTATQPPTMPPTTRSGLDAVPVLGALALCGIGFFCRRNRE
jgi:hypothetical protein